MNDDDTLDVSEAMFMSHLYGVNHERERSIKAIGAEIHSLLSPPILVDREFIDGLERAIEIIEGEQK